LDELRPAVVHDDGRRELGGADAEADDLLVLATGERRGGLRLALLRRALRHRDAALRRFLLGLLLLRRRSGLGGGLRLAVRRRLAPEGDVLLQKVGEAHCAAPATRRPRRASGRCSSVWRATPLRASRASNSSRRLVTWKAVSWLITRRTTRSARHCSIVC